MRPKFKINRMLPNFWEKSFQKCHFYPILEVFDNTLSNGLSKFVNEEWEWQCTSIGPSIYSHKTVFLFSRGKNRVNCHFYPIFGIWYNYINRIVQILHWRIAISKFVNWLKKVVTKVNISLFLWQNRDENVIFTRFFVFW